MKLLHKFNHYWSLIKSLQTALLTVTGIAGYMSARCPFTHWTTMTGLIASLLLSISGSTVLNMWYDRDIDSVMNRTHHRPLASGTISPSEALWLGLGLSAAGVILAAALSPLYGLLIFAGIFFDVIVYTILLKRRTCWSVVWGGIAGGMPILAGRALGMGQVDLIGILLALAILFWIPTHILTFSMRYQQDYDKARIPTFPSTYGEKVTRRIVALASLVAAGLIGTAAVMVGVKQGALQVLGILSGGLLVMAVLMLFKPNSRLNFHLFKYASVYMLASMVLLAF
ncbi:MAG TPA: heme o synthase [Anaerolineaceae bacterium]|jgi:protoheme IX farnesyltransferase|nr:heme o synthase [Anaerolineaceae bacterium]NMC17924.1 protoheme IX farnesyltransferase [Chloroflexota bacterium]HNS06349.1 heme o synthase [Anaerolineaceae bacterium]HOQ69334.1 heme o synthase [Anaerolineaceae bacterium]HOS53933.1 heme o synthase [Anaerolineaceae bacterium]